MRDWLLKSCSGVSAASATRLADRSAPQAAIRDKMDAAVRIALRMGLYQFATWSGSPRMPQSMKVSNW